MISKVEISCLLCLSFFILLGSCSQKNPENKENQSYTNIVDMTHTLNPSFPYIPHKVTFPFKMNTLSTIEGNCVAANEWHIHEHIGTQTDAPSHFVKGGKALDQLDVKKLIVPTIVIDISAKSQLNPDAELTKQDILEWEKLNGKIAENACVLIYSGWEEYLHDQKYIGLDKEGTKHFPGLSVEAAIFLINERNISGVGVDVLSIDPGYDNDYKTHMVILGAGKWALECVANMKEIPPKGATLFVGSLKIEGATGGVARLIAIW